MPWKARPAPGPSPRSVSIMTHPCLDGPSDGAEASPPQPHLVPRDTPFEHALDETAGKPEPVHAGGGHEMPPLGGERKPIVPVHLRTWQGIKSTAGKYLDAAQFHTAFHAIRSPGYLIMGIIW